MTTDNIPEQTGETILDAVEEKGILGLMTGVFSSPTEAFQSFDRKAKFSIILVPLILVILAGMALAFASAQFEAQDQYNLLKNSTTLPAEILQEMQNKAVAEITASDLGLKALLTIVIVPLITAFASLLVWGMGNFIFGGKTDFMRVWGVTILAGLIGGLGNLLKIPLVLAKETTAVTYGLAALLPGKDITSVLYSFFFFLDGFVVWSVIVCGLGYAVIYKFTPGKGIVLSAVVTLLGVAIGMAGTAIGLSFAGVEITPI